MSGRALRKKAEPLAQRVQHLEEKNLALSRTLRILEEARAQLVDQYDFAPVGFVTLDAKGCIREINLTAARMLGRERSRLLTMPFLTQVARPSVPAFLHHLRECRSQQTEIISEVNLRVGRGGDALPVELRSVPVPDLRGAIVYRTGLVAALHHLGADVTQRSRVRCAVECDDRLTLDDADVATHLYRIAQEAVANAIKHGRAKTVQIQLVAEQDTLTLRVRDDGKGIPANPSQSGMGLHLFHYRARLIGASIDVRRMDPGGCQVTCSLPG